MNKSKQENIDSLYELYKDDIDIDSFKEIFEKNKWKKYPMLYRVYVRGETRVYLSKVIGLSVPKLHSILNTEKEYLKREVYKYKFEKEGMHDDTFVEHILKAHYDEYPQASKMRLTRVCNCFKSKNIHTLKEVRDYINKWDTPVRISHVGQASYDEFRNFINKLS